MHYSIFLTSIDKLNKISFCINNSSNFAKFSLFKELLIF